MIPLALIEIPAGTLANHPLLDSIRSTLSAGPRQVDTVIFLSGVVAFLLLIMMVGRHLAARQRPPAAEEHDYLTVAVDVLGLSESDRRDLQIIARGAGVKPAAAMLLSPNNLAHAVTIAAGTGNDRGLHARMNNLCVRLFGIPLPEQAP